MNRLREGRKAAKNLALLLEKDPGGHKHKKTSKRRFWITGIAAKFLERWGGGTRTWYVLRCFLNPCDEGGI
jgi:hypothetical protein